MRTELIGTEQVSAIPQYIQSQLLKLMFRYQSPMRVAFHAIRDKTWKGRIVYMLDWDSDKVLAWGLLVWKPGATQPEIMLYTRAAARGAGHAKQVFWALRNSLENPEYTYYPHNETAHRFYMARYAERVAGNIPQPVVRWIAQ